MLCAWQAKVAALQARLAEFQRQNKENVDVAEAELCAMQDDLRTAMELQLYVRAHTTLTFTRPPNARPNPAPCHAAPHKQRVADEGGRPC